MLHNLNICQSCPQLIEEDEVYCLKCSMFDTIEADSTDKYLDELLVDDILNQLGSDGIEGVSIQIDDDYISGCFGQYVINSPISSFMLK